MGTFSRSFYSLGLLRLATVAPEHRVADVGFNLKRMVETIRILAERDCRLLVFPELGLSAYSCGDLFFQPLLLKECEDALYRLAEESALSDVTLIVGAPIAQGGRIYNCAVFISGGKILGIVPKRYLPNTGEFYDERWFTSGRNPGVLTLFRYGEEIPFGTDLLFRLKQLPDCLVGIEICEDAWVTEPPSGAQALRGATLLLNLSASPETLGKEKYRRDLVKAQSARCLAAYAYASAGPGESTTDLVFSGHSLIAENGQILAETKRFCFDSNWAIADIDIEQLVNERLRNNCFADGEVITGRVIEFSLADALIKKLQRPVSPTPFVPHEESERCNRCDEIFAIQTTGLARRLRHTGSQKVVLGISGGLDSTLALLVAVKAFDKIALDRKGILAVTLPGFGTTQRTRNNAVRIAELLGVTLQTISIDAAVRGHFKDINHPEEQYDIVFENAQARERTQILMDLANQVEGLVVGTGDLSELALGWCTYNADHMSMYGVNVGVPKTLVRYLVEWCADKEFAGETVDILRDISATPVSPELLPPDLNGEIDQKTEEQVGPYLLHDFFLYHLVRHQFAPDKILFLAVQAFAGSYEVHEILHWLDTFYRRFFNQQFKRSCLPDGPKIGSVALSPRGDWRMPSDASVALWIDRINALRIEVGLVQ
ncbi:MAG: NAD(+) synthase [Desulfuromonadales bacterium]|nr:NAD(+) synthase [Desulfuromonadales bacterium]